MKRLAATLGAVIVGATLATDCPAANPVFPQGEARRSMGNLRPSTPPSQTPQSPPAAGHRHRHNPSYAPYYPRYGGVYRDPYYHDPYYDNYDYRYGYPHRRPRYYRGPVFLPAETLYGPGAVQRFMGGGGVSVPRVQVIVPPVAVAAPVAAPVAGPFAAPVADQVAVADDVRPGLLAAETKALATAQKYIGFGDLHFRNEKYTDAYLRYRRAVREAPDLAEGYFREGYGLIARGNYDLAARAIKRGLALDPAWPDSGFSSRQLYGANDMAKQAHLDALAHAAEKAPDDPDLMFLLGVFLHFDGQPNRAELFFAQATRLNRGADTHLRAFAAAN